MDDVPPRFCWRAFLQHFLSLAVHSLSFTRSMFGTRDCYSFNTTARELMRRRSCSCRTLLFFVAILNIFTDLPSINGNRCIAFRKRFRKVRRSPCCSCRRSNPSILRWTYWSSASGSSPEGKAPCSGGSRTAQSTSWPCLCDLYPAVRL